MHGMAVRVGGTELLALLSPAGAQSTPISAMLTWSAVLLVLIVIAFLAYAQLKRWMNSTDEPAGEGFTFSDLRDLHRQGKLSDQEYEAARAQLLSATQRAAGTLPDPLAGRTAAAGQPRRSGPDSGKVRQS